jgi:hypothetical protein
MRRKIGVGKKRMKNSRPRAYNKKEGRFRLDPKNQENAGAESVAAYPVHD